MFGVIAELIKIPLQGIVNHFKQKGEIKKAASENKARLLRDESTNNHAWEMAQLEGKDIWLRRLTFGILSFPVVMAWFDPDLVKEYFDVGLASMPEWYIYVYMGIIGAIWGISEFKELRKR